MEPRYRMLYFVRSVFRVLAWVIVVLGIALAVIVLVPDAAERLYVGVGPWAGSIVGCALILLGTALYWAMLIAYAEWTSVVTDTSEINRTTAELLRSVQGSTASRLEGEVPPAT